ncbi:MAG: LemA family protein [Bacteriovoracaceae bacterium]
MKKLFLIMFASLFLVSCGIQSIPQSQNQVDADWAEVQNQYKRRNDLIPNLVNAVKGYAKHESATLEAVMNARAKASQITIDPKSMSEAQLKNFGKAQGELSQALGKLMMVTENYPNLKADENFRSLQAQLEGTENRITIARRRYIEGVKEFNNLVTVFPTSLTNSMMFKLEKKPQFTIEESETKVPQVQF